MKSNKVISKIVASTLLCSMVGYTLPVFAYTKDETVYSKLDSEGKNYKTIVSTHIENSEYADTINDMSDLLNIKNTSGDETYTQDGNKFVWNANKNDIYYQGESEKELPIECKVKYELDGKEVSANEIAGKSGKVKITLQYTNKEERTININGKDEKMYVPFVVVAGTIIKDENARNIEISSGKVVDDGTKTVIVGMAMPGLQESLGISSDEIEIPNNIEITMDATNFETSSIMSYVTPKVIEEDDLTIFDDLDEMYDKVNTLQSSMNQIQDGANTLKDGTTELEAGANTLKNGVNTAYSGAQTITSEVEKSTQSLKNDNSEALDNATLESIKKQAAESSKLTDEQKAQIKAQAQSGATLTQEQKNQISAQAKAKAVLTETQKTQITALAKQGAVLTDAQKAQIKTQAKEKAVLTDAQKTQIIANAQSAYPTTLTEAEKTLILTTAQNTATQTAMQTSTTVAKQVGNQAKKTFTYKVVSQMSTLGNGLNQLTSGLSELNNGATTLANGTTQINDGATTLADGIKTFNEEGIKKICNYINGDAKDLTTRVEKLTELSKEYNNFTMIDGENSGEVKFIMIIDAVKQQTENEQNKEEAIVEENK